MANLSITEKCIMCDDRNHLLDYLEDNGIIKDSEYNKLGGQSVGWCVYEIGGNLWKVRFTNKRINKSHHLNGQYVAHLVKEVKTPTIVITYEEA